MKKLKFLLIITFIFTLISCNSSPKKEITTNDSRTKENLSYPTKNNYSSIKSLGLNADDISIFIDGVKLELNSNIYLSKNRYYICLNELTDLLGGSYKKDGGIIEINIKDNKFKIDIGNFIVTNNLESFQINNLLTSDNEFYFIDFCDLSRILDLYTQWNKETKTIYCKTNGNILNNVQSYTPKIETLGFLRLEDIAIQSQPINSDYFERLRVITNYLSKRNVPYHIAWIPRAVYPSLNLDFDPLQSDSFTMAEMVYTLQFITEHNGLIGIHGYTHQYGNEDSGVGTEFGPKHPDTNIFKEHIEAAINTANYLDIPISFFESPHYATTPDQNKIAENYFKILYHPLQGANIPIDLTKPQLSPYNKSSYYISTPLDYIYANNVDASVEALKNCSTKKMGSIFYHPPLEFQYISLQCIDNVPNYTYDDNSPLKRIISIFEDKGFKLSKVSDIN